MDLSFHNEVASIINLYQEEVATYITPRTVSVGVQDSKSIVRVEFTFPLKYPNMTPAVIIHGNNKVSGQNLEAYRERALEIIAHVKNIPYMDSIVKEMNTLMYCKDNSIDSLHFPDSFETMRLLVQSKLSQGYRDHWVNERTKALDTHTLLSPEERDIFLIYALYAYSNKYNSQVKSIDLQQCILTLSLIKGLLHAPPPTPSFVTSKITDVINSPYISSSLMRVLEDRFVVDTTTVPVHSARFFDDFSIYKIFKPGAVVARNRIDRRLYTVKTEYVGEKTTIANMEYVVTMLSQLQHRYIVRYYNSWVEQLSEESASGICSSFLLPFQGAGSILFIQMEYSHNRTLLDLINTKRFAEQPELQWGITRKILEALHYLHSRRVSHRNLSPSSIYVDNDNNIKIGDLGTAPAADEIDIVDGAREDMFAFGLVFFQIWHPLADDERAGALAKLAAGEIPGEWADAFPIQAKIARLLMQEPAKRPSAIDLLQAKLIPALPASESARDFSALLRAISTGTLNLSTHAPEIVETLFSDSRRLPFRESEFSGDEGFTSRLGVFRAQAITRWYQLCSKRNAAFFFAPFMHRLQPDEKQPVAIMGSDGSLYALRSAGSRYLARWIAHNNIHDARLCSKSLLFKEQQIKKELIQEDEILTYDIVAPSYSAGLDVECCQLLLDFVDSILPDAQLMLLLSHPLLASNLPLELARRNTLDVKDLEKFVKSQPDRPELAASLERVKNFAHIVNARKWKFVPPRNVISPLTSTTSMSNISFAQFTVDEPLDINFVIYQYEVARIVRTARANAATRFHMQSLRINLKHIFQIFKKGAEARSQVSVFIIPRAGPMPEPGRGGLMRGETVEAPQWAMLYCAVQPIAKNLRSKGYIVSIAPNSNADPFEIAETAKREGTDAVLVAFEAGKTCAAYIDTRDGELREDIANVLDGICPLSDMPTRSMESN